MIEGESGTGKELIARRLHQQSPRRTQAFIPVNCAGVSETMFESQFFGHQRGAFTGAEQTMQGLIRAADGGTLFLDEVGEIPLRVQPKLLRVFQDGEVIPVGATTPVLSDTRFVAATNRSLSEAVRQGRFREDLFYRLNIVRIYLPPLRERPEDVEPLLDHFLTRYAARGGRPAIGVGPGVRRRLAAHPWPGNVRELRGWVERLYATGESPERLAAALLREAGRSGPRPVCEEFDSPMSLPELERWAIRRAMAAAGNNLPRAAALLKIHRTTLWRKLKQHQLS